MVIPEESSEAASAKLFPPTRWSVVERLKGDRTTVAVEALGELYLIYRRPLEIYLRQCRFSPGSAEELVQAFFAYAVNTGLLAKAERERGLLRSFLLRSLKNFMIDETRKQSALKRGGRSAHVSLDELCEREWNNLTTEDKISAEHHFDRAWARALSAIALGDVERQLRKRGNQALFLELSPYLVAGPNTPTYSKTASRLGMTVNAVKLASQRLRRAYFAELRKCVEKEVADRSRVDSETRYVLELLQA